MYLKAKDCTMFDCTKARSPAAAAANVSPAPTSAALVLFELNPPT